MNLCLIKFVAIGFALVGLTFGPAGVFAQSYPRLPTNLSHMTLGYIYFNRPGASVGQHNSDLTACLGEAIKTFSADAALSSGRNGLVGDLIEAGLSAAANRGTVASALENCMLVRGWRVMLLAEADGKAIAAQSNDQVALRISPLVGSAKPEGVVFRVWNNDAANGTMARWSLRPPHINDGNLSLRLLNLTNLREARAAVTAEQSRDVPIPAGNMLKPDKSWPVSRFEPAQIPAVPSEGALLVFGMSGGITGIEIERVGEEPKMRPVLIDRKPDRYRAVGKWGAYLIPAGRWRVYGLTKGLLSINMCLGSPSFSAKPGDVLFAGLFDFDAPEIGPDMSLDRARAWLNDSKIASQIKPVEWTNGSLGNCGDSTIFAIEFPGAPFAPGYKWGSKASRQ